MIYALALLLILKQSIGSSSTDMIELNHVHNCQGELSFTQVIFWQWDVVESRYSCRSWTMVDDDRKWPTRLGNRMHVAWHDTIGHVNRDVHSNLFRESWTHNDPEREDAKRIPQDCREGFVKR